MPPYQPRRRSGRGEIMPPLSKLDKIDLLLKVQLETFPQKELSKEEITRWHRDLSNYPMDSIEFAFDNWRRNGHYFPVPNDILEQCKAYSPISTVQCDSECKSRHGKGYGEGDILWLWKKRSTIDGPLDPDGWEELFRELDAKRADGAPSWRNHGHAS